MQSASGSAGLGLLIRSQGSQVRMDPGLPIPVNSSKGIKSGGSLSLGWFPYSQRRKERPVGIGRERASFLSLMPMSLRIAGVTTTTNPIRSTNGPSRLADGGGGRNPTNSKTDGCMKAAAIPRSRGIGQATAGPSLTGGGPPATRTKNIGKPLRPEQGGTGNAFVRGTHGTHNTDFTSGYIKDMARRFIEGLAINDSRQDSFRTFISQISPRGNSPHLQLDSTKRKVAHKQSLSLDFGNLTTTSNKGTKQFMFVLRSQDEMGLDARHKVGKADRLQSQVRSSRGREQQTVTCR